MTNRAKDLHLLAITVILVNFNILTISEAMKPFKGKLSFYIVHYLTSDIYHAITDMLIGIGNQMATIISYTVVKHRTLWLPLSKNDTFFLNVICPRLKLCFACTGNYIPGKWF